MFKRLRNAVGRRQREPDPLVKVAGIPTQREAQTSLEALEARGINGVLKEDDQRLGAYELWVPASQEPQARLLLGLSGHSVIRRERKHPAQAPDEGKKHP